MKLRALEALEDRPRKNDGLPHSYLLFSYFLDTALAASGHTKSPPHIYRLPITNVTPPCPICIDGATRRIEARW
jgi:hypothetical protein